MQKHMAIGLLMLALAACARLVTTPQPGAARPIGLLQVTITGIGEGSTPSATAQWVRPQLSGQTIAVVPINGTNALNDVQFIRVNVGFLDNDVSNIRSVLATFDLVNRTTASFNNFTLYAVNMPTNLGGTGIIGMTAGTGAAITDPSVARGFKPTHGMRPTANSPKVNEDIADLQFFTLAESADVLNQAVLSNILPNTATVLEYGFVARNHSGGRTIHSPNIISPSDCTTVACKGTVTLSYQLPKVSPRSANPFSFSLYFVVANETVQMGSQSVDEQSANTVMGHSSFSGFSQLRTLAGSSLLLDDRLYPVCRVRTAIGPDLFLGPDPIPSAAGSLDVCFGASGKRTTGFGSGNDEAHAMAIQSDGKILVAGSSWSGSSNDFALVRYNTGGSLDTSFDGDGKAITDFGLDTDNANSLAIQPNGKIVVAGDSYNGFNYDIALVRYNANGTLDTGFDGDGKVVTGIGTGNDQAYSLAIQPDGKIVVTGRSLLGGNYVFALVRYNTDGSLDTSFSLDGIVITGIGPGDDIANSLAIQPNGKMVVAGCTNCAIGGDIALARYNTDGTLDTSFDVDGRATTAIGSSMDIANSLAIYPNDGGPNANKIVVGGYSNNGLNDDFALVRYNTDGSLDTSFDGDGIVTTDFASTDQAYSLALQSDGRIVVGGKSYDGSTNDFALARYNTGGSLDTSFDGDGKVTTAIGSGGEEARSLVIQSDGQIVLAGFSYNGSNNDFALARYNP